MSDIKPGTKLGEVNDIPNPGGRPANLEDPPVLLVRTDEIVRAYINICPHAGRPLSLPSGKALVNNAILVCPFHGASFEVENGQCVGGPAGKSALKPVPIDVRDGVVYSA